LVEGTPKIEILHPNWEHEDFWLSVEQIIAERTRQNMVESVFNRIMEEQKCELAGDEYVNVWDSCGGAGYRIPWANWKAQKLLPTSHQRRYVDTKFVNLLARESVTQASFDNARKGMPIVFLDDYGGTWDGIDWEAVRRAIVRAARESNCVIKVVAQPPYEVVDARMRNGEAELEKVRAERDQFKGAWETANGETGDLLLERERLRTNITELKVKLAESIAKYRSRKDGQFKRAYGGTKKRGKR
jgi:hypothetical protein